MSLIRYIALIVLCTLFLPRVHAQFVDYGSDPARFKWNVVNLEHYNLIYPRGLDSMAYRYALYLENVYPYSQNTIGKPPMKFKFPVVLHPANMSSNGLVAWTPRRMELLTTPSAKQESQLWDKHLVLHESRHVFQTSKVMRRWAKPLYYLLGEQASGIAMIFLPTWFLEGDAVSTETAMSNAGRGRLPEFNMIYRAQMMAGKTFFSFDKWNLGSYKDYTGSFYALGYDMTSYARYKHGADIWDKTTTKYMSTYPFFSLALKHHTGTSISGLFRETFSHLRNQWEGQDTSYVTPSYLSPPTKSYTSYRYPLAVNDSMAFAVKSGLNDINSLVFIANGKEEHVCYLGNLNGRLIQNKNRIYWTEIVPGYRWTHENYSVIKYFDIETRKIKTLTPGRRFLSPTINEEGTTIAVSTFTLKGENQLVLLDAKTGEDYSYHKTPGNAFIKELAFGNDGKIAAIVINNKGTAIIQLNTQTGKWSRLLSTTSANITAPVWKNDNLYFESGLNGTNNIYQLDIKTLRTYRLTAARFGAFDPAFNGKGNELFVSDYQPIGYRIASLPKDSLKNEEVSFDEPYRFPLAENLAQQEQFNLDSAKLKAVDFTPMPYRKFPHLFKIHSWAPFFYNVAEAMSAGSDDFTTIVKPGAMILSQNTLNTAMLEAGWYYKDKNHYGSIGLTYKGWLPIVHLNAEYGGNAFDLKWEKNEEDRYIMRSAYSGKNYLEAEARVYIPFNLTKNHYIRGIQPSVSYYFTNNRYQQFESRKLSNFQYILPELWIYNYRRMAHREILPRWGYQFRMQFLNTPLNTENYGNLYTARLTTYWPGIIRNQGLMLRLAYQYQSVDDKVLYLPKRLLDKTRGYDDYPYATRQQIGFKADYAFSVFSPDINFGPVLYIRRLRSNLFYDHTRNQASENSGWTTQSSYGADIIFDLNVIRMRFPVSLGTRLIQPIDYGKFQAEMLFSINF